VTVELALVTVSIVVWITAEARSSATEPHTALPREVLTGASLLAIHAAGALESSLRASSGPPLTIAVGLLVLALGIALRLTSIRALGDGFVSTVAPPARRVMDGPYRWLRHPSEVGLIAAAAGAAIALSSVTATAILMLVLVPLSISRATQEDRLFTTHITCKHVSR
jgi:protein-S-isoprenylcysteine O-methyltransferase Ste14